MTAKQLSILLGGVLPAVLLGVSGVFQKVGTKAGIATGPFLITVGLTAVAVGSLITLAERDATFNPRALLLTAVCGGCWALGVAGVLVALRRYDAEISRLVPLYNMNTLVAVAIGLVFLAEARTVNAAQLVVASTLIVLGGVLAARA